VETKGAHHRGKGGCWSDHGGRSDGYEQVALVTSLKCLI
jgi:hypothetical protein